jgi:hypothetical protein
VKFDTVCGVGVFMKTCRENANVFEIGEKYRSLYLKTEVHFIVAGDIKSP